MVKRKVEKLMSTSSIFANIVITDAVGADRLVSALEAAEKAPRKSCKVAAKNVTDPQEIRRLFATQNTVCLGKKGREQLQKFIMKTT